MQIIIGAILKIRKQICYIKRNHLCQELEEFFQDIAVDSKLSTTFLETHCLTIFKNIFVVV